MGNQFKEVAIITCLKSLLFVFSVWFWMMGFLFLIIGLWAEFELHKYMQLSPEFSGTAPHVIIGIACLMIVVSSIAFSSVVNGQPVLLYIYGGFLGCILMMVAGVGAAISVYRNTFPKSLRDGLTQTISSNTQHKSNLDFTQSTFRCCGISNYTDWILLSPQKVIPVSCCYDLTKCVTANYSEVYQVGCYNVISQFVEDHFDVLVALAIGTAFIPLVGTVLSCCVAIYIKKSKYDAVN